jgi:hypothetical protein
MSQNKLSWNKTLQQKRGILNVSLPAHSEDTVYTCSAALRHAQLEIVRLRQSVEDLRSAVEEARREVEEKDAVIESQRQEILEMAKRGDMANKVELGTRRGGSGSTVQKMERVKRAGRMMELLMDAREREAYDPL